MKKQNKPNPDAARLQCVTAPATTTPEVKPDDPAGYIKKVAEAAVNSVHPCNVRTCTSPSNEVDYRWDTASKTLVKDKTGVCTMCFQLKMNMCDAAGNRLPDPTSVVGNPILIEQGIVVPSPSGCVG